MKFDILLGYDNTTKEYILKINSKETFRTKNHKRLTREVNKIMDEFDRVKGYKLR